jgi:general secretion pathway protein G
MEISKICQALETMYSTYGKFPTNDEGLESLAQPSSKFPEGILSKLPIDPWGRPYQYATPGRERAYDVVCLGADGREGGEGADGDISSSTLDSERRS